jgi:hydrogenase maturation factor
MADILGIDPLGLIGSGSLLICCRPQYAQRLIDDLLNNDIAVADIGVVTSDQPGIQAFENGLPALWPRFDGDEITRLFAQG